MIKDDLKIRCEANGKRRILPFLHWVLLYFKHLLEKNIKTEQYISTLDLGGTLSMKHLKNF